MQQPLDLLLLQMMTPPCPFDESIAHIGSQAEKDKIMQLLFCCLFKLHSGVLFKSSQKENQYRSSPSMNILGIDLSI